MPRNGNGGGESAPEPPRSSSNTRLRTRPDALLVVCRGFKLVTSISALLCIAVNILSAIRSFKKGSDVFDGIFRCYAVLIAFFVVVAETEWEFVMKFWKVLEYWAGRGMLQILYVFYFRYFSIASFSLFFSSLFSRPLFLVANVAVMTRAFSDDSGSQKDLVLLQNIACYMLLACGLVYVFSVR
ncbi:hypothetical protein Pint_33435 [Pistacia integerrima]|uniref:Uncharacterized protein n=1 Tax=Pistacia integerrima TaxID=434235 RepID=A0ACC0X5B9_9ROSI|nr:hypothetical protein Pint_33435 [Pistacia integerrima]